MRRREFITLLGGAAAGIPFAARAQQPAMPAIGYLSGLGRNDRPELVDAFHQGLGELGYAEGRNVAIEYRFAENQFDRLPALAADLVARRAAVIAATGSTKPVLAAKAATGTIPIVFTYGGDPVEAGFVTSLNRPGGNITGVTIFSNVLTTKIVGLLHEIVPQAAVIALLLNPEDPLISASMQHDAQEAVRAFGRQLLPLNASTPSEIELALATLRSRAGALIVGGNPFFGARRQQIIALTMRDAIPVAATAREFIEEGALMTYGNDTPDMYRRAGLYAGRILKGEKPAGLPVDQATRFELRINLKTAKRLGLSIPSGIFSIADEVIE
jgi:putative tryptophan/tyrosine transport system substrate-binding protein